MSLSDSRPTAGTGVSSRRNTAPSSSSENAMKLIIDAYGAVITGPGPHDRPFAAIHTTMDITEAAAKSPVRALRARAR